MLLFNDNNHGLYCHPSLSLSRSKASIFTRMEIKNHRRDLLEEQSNFGGKTQ